MESEQSQSPDFRELFDSYPLPLRYLGWVSVFPLPRADYYHVPTSGLRREGRMLPDYPDREVFSLSLVLDTTPKWFVSWLSHHTQRLTALTYPIQEGGALLSLGQIHKDESGVVPAFTMDGFAVSIGGEQEEPTWIHRATALLKFIPLQVSQYRTEIVINSVPNCLWSAITLLLQEAAFAWPEAGDDIWKVISSRGALDTFDANSGGSVQCKIGAPRLEDRDDWPDKVEKLTMFEALLAKGNTKPAAAKRVGVSLNALKEWQNRLSTKSI